MRRLSRTMDAHTTESGCGQTAANLAKVFTHIFHQPKFNDDLQLIALQAIFVHSFKIVLMT